MQRQRILVWLLWWLSSLGPIGFVADGPSVALGQQPGWRDPTRSINGWSGYSLWQLGQGTPAGTSGTPSVPGRATYWHGYGRGGWYPPWWSGGGWYSPGFGYGWGYFYLPPVQAYPSQFGFPVPDPLFAPGIPIVDFSDPLAANLQALQQQAAVQQQRADVAQAHADAFAAADRAANQDRTAQYVAKLRTATAANRQRADRLIREGDALLRESQDRRAAVRYRQATTAAPDLASTHWRLGLAELMQGDYPTAIDEAYVALDVGGIPQPQDLPLSDLFADRRGDLPVLIDRVSERALQDPDQGRWLLWVGLLLWADGQSDRAATFFEASAAQQGEHQRFAQLFQ